MELFLEFEHIGNKKRQEDIFFSFENTFYNYFFIFDGHGYKNENDSLVDYLNNNNYFKKKCLNYFSNIQIDSNKIKTFFLSLDEDLCKKIPSSGSCVSGLIFDKKNEEVFLLNIGDTIFQAYDKYKQKKIENNPHNLFNEEEMKRIIYYNKQHFIKNNRYKKLSITRTLGDDDCKELINDPLIACPEVLKIKIKNYSYFLLSSDGIKIFDIDYIINFCEDKNKVNVYCYNIIEKNLLLKKNIDNIYFIILKNKNQKIINKNKSKALCNEAICNEVICDEIIFRNLLSMNVNLFI